MGFPVRGDDWTQARKNMDIMDCNADIFNNGSFLELSGGMILALMPREVIMQPTTWFPRLMCLSPHVMTWIRATS
jgi:hypothetical protein